MVVVMPPSIAAKPIGIRMREGGSLLAAASPIIMGIIMTTTGVSLMKELSANVSIRLSNIVIERDRFHSRANPRPTPSSAPVRSMPCPRIISAQTATSPRLPNPRKNSYGCKLTPSFWNGNRWKPSARPVNTSKLVVSYRIRSLAYMARAANTISMAARA